MTVWILAFLLVVSIVVCIALVYYIRALIKSINDTNEITLGVFVSVADYREHLEKVYKMETFYGDSVLQGLLEHTRDMEEELAVVANEVSDLLGKPLIPEKVEEETDA